MQTGKILDCYDLLFPFALCFVIVYRDNFMQTRKRREEGKTEISGRSKFELIILPL
jgi:hypothetical protein